MFFSQDWRERIKAENPDAGFGMLVLPPLWVLYCCPNVSSLLPGEVGKLLGAKWKELDDEEKKVCCCRCVSAMFLLNLHIHLSLMLNKLQKIKSEQKKRKPRMRFVSCIPMPVFVVRLKSAFRFRVAKRVLLRVVTRQQTTRKMTIDSSVALFTNSLYVPLSCFLFDTDCLSVCIPFFYHFHT